MTASSQEDQRASEAVAAGMAAAQAHDTAAQAQHATAGSAVVVEQAQTPDSHAVEWSQPRETLSGPTPDNAGQNRSPVVDSPYDNRQSQPS